MVDKTRVPQTVSEVQVALLEQNENKKTKNDKPLVLISLPKRCQGIRIIGEPPNTTIEQKRVECIL
jgi:hypothetical protein